MGCSDEPDEASWFGHCYYCTKPLGLNPAPALDLYERAICDNCQKEAMRSRLRLINGGKAC